MRTQEFKAGQQNALTVFEIAMKAPGCSPQEKIEVATRMLIEGISPLVAGCNLEDYAKKAKSQLGTNPAGDPPKAPTTKASNKFLNSVEDDYARYRQDHGLTDRAQAEEEHPRIEHGKQAVQILKAGS